jgi:hypothetical protein
MGQREQADHQLAQPWRIQPRASTPNISVTSKPLISCNPKLRNELAEDNLIEGFGNSEQDPKPAGRLAALKLGID